MISWMQKHKKYLVITIWISTIAFVGAGFVGWGAYKYGSAGDAMAEVGDTKITIQEFQNRYARLYNYYAQIFKGNFDQAKAKKMGLDKATFNELIKEALLINFAHQMGLIVTDEEIAQRIASMPEFQTNGKFDKNLYIKILEQNHLRPKDFEAQIAKELLLQKLRQAISPALFDLEFQTVASALFMGDKVEYKPLEASQIPINIDEKELKKFYEEHKDRYQTPIYYDIALIEVKPQNITIETKELQEYYKSHRHRYTDSEGKILPFEQAKERVAADYRMKLAKKEALRKYIQLKKGQITAQMQKRVSSEHSDLPKKLMEQLRNAPEGKTFKPIQTAQGYIVAKLLKKEPPKPLSFEKAKEMVRKDYENEKRMELLRIQAQKLAKTFHGTVTPGFISRDDVDKIKGLEPAEAAKFLQELFIQQSPQGYIQLSDTKVVLYRILDQVLQNRPKVDKNQALITDNGLKLKQNVQDSNLLRKLQSMYKIKIYKGI